MDDPATVTSVATIVGIILGGMTIVYGGGDKDKK